MKMTKCIKIGVTLLMAALVNAYADYKNPATYDINIENNSDDKMLRVSIISENPEAEINGIELRGINKQGRSMPLQCELEDCKATSMSIELYPGDKYVMKDMPIGLPAYYSVYAYTIGNDFIYPYAYNIENDSIWHIDSGSLDGKFFRTGTKGFRLFKNDRADRDIWYNKLENKGNFGFIFYTVKR